MDAQSIRLLDEYLVYELWRMAKNMDSESVLLEYYRIAQEMSKYGPEFD